jgi:hypothetical protein
MSGKGRNQKGGGDKANSSASSAAGGAGPIPSPVNPLKTPDGEEAKGEVQETEAEQTERVKARHDYAEDVQLYGEKFTVSLGGKHYLDGGGEKYTVLMALMNKKVSELATGGVSRKTVVNRLAVTSIMFHTKPANFLMNGKTKKSERGNGIAIDGAALTPYFITLTESQIKDLKDANAYQKMEDARKGFPEWAKVINMSMMKLMALYFLEKHDNFKQTKIWRRIHSVDEVSKKPSEVTKDNPYIANLPEETKKIHWAHLSMWQKDKVHWVNLKFDFE